MNQNQCFRPDIRLVLCPEKDMGKACQTIYTLSAKRTNHFHYFPNHDFQLTHTFQKSDNLEVKRE